MLIALFTLNRNLSSHDTVDKLFNTLEILESKGFIERKENFPRALKIIRSGA
ncbi:hypothetical protein EV204_11236 [Tissierella praeacuta]|uniref:hypothetical protein n=1 Tax=Tissierella praeacuta TaxID=43131 RepID=UPI0010CEFED0|nr:hypothetical protein [Tissierella praeacuta]TCU67485.1 hypothetical protein EV204_11236 [Tissierella praeacuta]